MKVDELDLPLGSCSAWESSHTLLLSCTVELVLVISRWVQARQPEDKIWGELTPTFLYCEMVWWRSALCPFFPFHLRQSRADPRIMRPNELTLLLDRGSF